MGPVRAGTTRETIAAAINLSFLHDLPTPVVEAIQAGAIVHHVAAGRVFADETQPDWVGIVISGLARIYINLPDGPELPVRYARRGEAVGIAALAGTQHPVTVRAITACRVLQLDQDRARALVESEPAAARAVARELAARLFDTYEVLASQVYGSVRQRLAGYLLEVVDLSGEDGDADGVPRISRTHQEMAETIGSAREVVSKALESLADHGMVELHRGEVRLLDPVGLQLLARHPINQSGRRPTHRPESSTLTGRPSRNCDRGRTSR